MAKVKLLIDIDVFIDYLNTGSLRTIFQSKVYEIYYSVITKKELISKPGLKEAERRAILSVLKRHRIILLDNQVTITYSYLRHKYPSLEKEYALIAASALVRKVLLVTRSCMHYKIIEGL